jgi:hypothetical protein
VTTADSGPTPQKKKKENEPIENKKRIVTEGGQPSCALGPVKIIIKENKLGPSQLSPLS